MDAPGEGPKRPNPQLERFVKAFEQSTRSQDALAQAFEGLARLIAHNKDGLIATVDDLRGDIQNLTLEIRGLRKDLRASAKSRGLGSVFDLLGGGA